MLNKIKYIIATLGFIGFIPVAPGTFGTAAAFVLAAIVKPGDTSLLVMLVPLFLAGIISSQSAERILERDSNHIVIDEFCGYLISILFLPKTFFFLIAAFILFRLFDILKPPPIRLAEQYFYGGTAIMLDDLLAAIYANLLLQFVNYVS